MQGLQAVVGQSSASPHVEVFQIYHGFQGAQVCDVVAGQVQSAQTDLSAQALDVPTGCAEVQVQGVKGWYAGKAPHAVAVDQFQAREFGQSGQRLQGLDVAVG